MSKDNAATFPTSQSWSLWLQPVRMMDERRITDSSCEAGDPAEADMSLMRAVATGDQRAMATLVERWQQPAINFFYRALGSRETAEDLSQQLFIRIYKAAPRYEPTAKFSTYLFSIARRLIINEYRRRQRKPLDPVDPADLSGTVDGREALNHMELEEAFRLALGSLPENQRSALLLFKQQELSYQEIARVLETSESSVKTWIHRGRQRLKTLLKDQLLK